MTDETERGAKAPRADATNAKRQRSRNAPLNEWAKSKGWTGISEYLTALLAGICEIPPCPPEVIAKRKNRSKE